MTRGEVLRYAIAFAVRRSRKIIRGLKEGLTEDERYAVADHAVAQLKERGDPWRSTRRRRRRSRHRHNRVGRKAFPPTPPPRLPFLGPGLPGRGLTFWAL